MKSFSINNLTLANSCSAHKCNPPIVYYKTWKSRIPAFHISKQLCLTRTTNTRVVLTRWFRRFDCIMYETRRILQPQRIRMFVFGSTCTGGVHHKLHWQTDHRRVCRHRIVGATLASSFGAFTINPTSCFMAHRALNVDRQIDAL